MKFLRLLKEKELITLSMRSRTILVMKIAMNQAKLMIMMPKGILFILILECHLKSIDMLRSQTKMCWNNKMSTIRTNLLNKNRITKTNFLELRANSSNTQRKCRHNRISQLDNRHSHTSQLNNHITGTIRDSIIRETLVMKMMMI